MNQGHENQGQRNHGQTNQGQGNREEGNQQQWTLVDEYLSSMLAPADGVLQSTLQSSTENGLPEINVSPNQGKLLHLLARIQGARRILEIGTLGGYSAIWMGRALPTGGSLITLEANPEHARLARKNIADAGLSDLVSVITGEALDSLKAMVEDNTKPFDLIFIDADKENNPNYLKWSIRLSRPGTVVVCDNVVRKGRLADPRNNDPDAVAMRNFFELCAAEPRLDSTAIQTVGIKGWDGFSISIVSG